MSLPANHPGRPGWPGSPSTWVSDWPRRSCSSPGSSRTPRCRRSLGAWDGRGSTRGSPRSTGRSLWNVALFALFGFVHSFFAQVGVQARVRAEGPRAGDPVLFPRGDRHRATARDGHVAADRSACLAAAGLGAGRCGDGRRHLRGAGGGDPLAGRPAGVLRVHRLVTALRPRLGLGPDRRHARAANYRDLWMRPAPGLHRVAGDVPPRADPVARPVHPVPRGAGVPGDRHPGRGAQADPIVRQRLRRVPPARTRAPAGRVRERQPGRVNARTGDGTHIGAGRPARDAAVPTTARDQEGGASCIDR